MKIVDYRISKEKDKYGNEKSYLKFKKNIMGMSKYVYLRKYHYKKNMTSIIKIIPYVIFLSLLFNILSYNIETEYWFTIIQTLSYSLFILIFMYYVIEVSMYSDKIVAPKYTDGYPGHKINTNDDIVEYFQEKVDKLNELYDIESSTEIIYSTRPINKVKETSTLKNIEINIKKYIY